MAQDIKMGLQSAFEVVFLAGLVAEGIGFTYQAVPGVIFTGFVLCAADGAAVQVVVLMLYEITALDIFLAHK